jgi:WD40 repeat protein
LAKPRSEWHAQDGVLALVFDPRGVWLASGISNSKIIHTLKGHSASVTCLAVSSDGSLLASGSRDKNVKLWEVRKEEELHTLAGHTDRVTSVAFSPDGRWLASASADKTIRIWSVPYGELIRSLEGHSGAINSIAFSPDGQLLAPASDDQTIRLWEPSTGNLLRRLSGHNSRVLSVAFSPDGKVLAPGGEAQVHLLASSRASQLKLWDPVSGTEDHSFRGVLGDARSLAFKPDNKVLANVSGISDVYQITYWNLGGQNRISTWYAHYAPINALAYSSDGRWLASGAGGAHSPVAVAPSPFHFCCNY